MIFAHTTSTAFLNPTPKQKKFSWYKLALLVTMLLFYGCANMLAPTGGPKDETPPQVLKTVPANNQVLYSGKSLTLEFDEYFTVENFNSELIVSPPLKHKPEYKIKGKRLIIKWSDTLLEKTTYTFLLGNMIKDVNEGNEAENILITFSTGSHIDTAIFEGRILKINDLEPPENSFVYLSTKPLEDSTFFKPDPLYLTRSNKAGFFKFQGLKEGSYQMYYIEDKNGNKKVDPGEYVGFLDTFVDVRHPQPSSFSSSKPQPQEGPSDSSSDTLSDPTLPAPSQPQEGPSDNPSGSSSDTLSDSALPAPSQPQEGPSDNPSGSSSDSLSDPTLPAPTQSQEGPSDSPSDSSSDTLSDSTLPAPTQSQEGPSDSPSDSSSDTLSDSTLPAPTQSQEGSSDSSSDTLSDLELTDSSSAAPEPFAPMDYYAFPYFPLKQRIVKSLKSLSRNTVSLSWQWGVYPVKPHFWELVQGDTLYLPIVFESGEELEITTSGRIKPQIWVTNQEGVSLFLSDTIEMLKKITEIQSNVKPTDSGMLIEFNYPVFPTDSFYVTLAQDTLNPDFKWFMPDSHQIHLTFVVEEGAEFKATFKDSSLRYLDTFFNAKLPAFSYRFNPPPVRSKHRVTLQRTAEPTQNNPLIVYVFKGEEATPHQTLLVKNQINEFEIQDLEEGTYTLWIVVDLNNNQIWDLGDIKTQKQPEPLFILEKPMEVKEGWDTDFIWELKP